MSSFFEFWEGLMFIYRWGSTICCLGLTLLLFFLLDLESGGDSYRSGWSCTFHFYGSLFAIFGDIIAAFCLIDPDHMGFSALLAVGGLAGLGGMGLPLEIRLCFHGGLLLGQCKMGDISTGMGTMSNQCHVEKFSVARYKYSISLSFRWEFCEGDKIWMLFSGQIWKYQFYSGRCSVFSVCSYCCS